MTKLMGWDLLTDQITERIRADLECNRFDATGDSEIEKLLMLAVTSILSLGMTQHNTMLRLGEENRHLYVPDSYVLFYEQQAQLDGWRVDFLFHCYEHGYGGKKKEWKKLIVECDGHAFHERTKEQAARDRSRDRWAVQNGFEIFRFTGSELWRDPMGCAEQIHEWAARCWP